MQSACRRTYLSLVALCACACAGTIVRPSDLPPPPDATLRRSGAVVLLLAGVPAPMADEVRRFSDRIGETREVALAPEEEVRVACEEPTDLMLRPRLGRVHFASNAPDRNSLFIYETAVVVGIPVTLISAGAWPYYAETVVEGELEAFYCAEQETIRHVDLFRLRSKGRGFVRTQTLRDAQFEGAARGVTRKLLSEAFKSFVHEEKHGE